MRRVSWTQVLVFGLVALLVFVLGIGVLFLAGGRGMGAMGPGMMGPWGGRGGWCPWCGGMGRFGGGLLGPIVGLTFACLLPLGLLALLVVGGIWLARNVDGGTSQPSNAACPSCGRAVEPDWQVCPTCGEDLNGE